MGAILAVTLAAAGFVPEARLDPLLASLVKQTADGDRKHESEFFKTFAQLARRSGLTPTDLARYESGGGARSGLSKGHAVVLRTRSGPYVVALLGTNSASVPGLTAQKLLLFDASGAVLDQLACGINTRYGDLATEAPAKAQADGADLVIRFVPQNPQSPWHNWHTVTYDGKPYTFRATDPTDWAKQGLVRVAVRKGKFGVLAPTLDRADLPAPQ